MDLTHVRFQGTPPPTRHVGLQPRSRRAAPGGIAASSEHVSTPLGGLPAFVLEQAGLDPASYRESPLRRRTPACLRAIRAESVTAARERLTNNPHLTDVALNTLLIGVSEFFRDPAVFGSLRTHVIPALAHRRRPLRVVSVGCSFGAELYSVAMLLAQAGLVDGSHLLGIDCRPAAVALAKTGVLARGTEAALDEDLRSRYFEATTGGWRVVHALRRQTEWRVMDATRDCPPGPWDLVMCRNLVIYLQHHAAAAMFERLSRHLAPGGFLVVGNAERPAAALKLTQIGRCVYKTHGV
jgi:chemotaxis protein methyltransferase CheR